MSADLHPQPEPTPARRAFTRRRGLQIGGLAALGGAAAAVYKLGPWARPLGANADIRLGIAGLRNKGTDHINHFREIHGCRVVAICDADSEFLDREKAAAAERNETVDVYRDYRSMLDRAEIDAVVIASPNHWHALMGMWALEAGKHLYVEKPLTHSLWEGRALVEAAEASGLVCQTGTQRRSDMAYPAAREWLAEGHLGRVERARAIVYRQRKKLTKRKSPCELPATLDYDLWCGPASKETLYRSRVHYDWHWVWNTGNGEIGNNGIHFIDVARWLLGDPPFPTQALSVGGRFGVGDDAGETPNTQLTLFSGDTPIIAECRALPSEAGSPQMDAVRGVREGVILDCEGGTLAWPVAYDAEGKKLKKFSSDDGFGHRVNWLRAIVDGRPRDVHAPLRNGHLSTACCHLANLSCRLAPPPTPAELASASSMEATGDLIEQLAAHLDRNGIDLGSTPIELGARLECGSDGALVGPLAEAADRLDRRAFRASYPMPGTEPVSQS